MLNELENFDNNVGVINTVSCCPALADDVCCISLSPSGLQDMLNVCLTYACQWRFRFNAKKSAVVQFTKSSREPELVYPWSVNGDLIPIQEEYSQLGVQMNRSFK